MGLHLTGSSVTQLNNAFAASLTATAVKTASYTAAAGDLIPVDATSGAVTVTLPTAPAARTRVAVKKIDSSANAVTISRGGSSDVFNKAGGSTSLTLTLTNQAISLQYSGGIWYVVGDDLPLGQLDTRFNVATANSDLAPLQDPTYYTTPTVVPIGTVSGVLYGTSGNTLYRSTDDAATWQAIHDFTVTYGPPIGIGQTANGEMFAVTSSAGLYSTGWGTNPATATWTLAVSATQTDAGFARAAFLRSTWDVYGQYVVVAEYVNPKNNARYLSVSSDNGHTFTTRYDLNTALPANITTTHWHAVSIDPFNGGTPRIWATHGDGPRGVYYSDNLGVSWTAFTAGGTSGFDLTASNMMTVTATAAGVVFTTDSDGPDGVYRVLRTTVATDMVLERMLMLGYVGDASGAALGFGSMGWRDPNTGLVWITFNATTPAASGSPTLPGYVFVTDGKRAAVAWTTPEVSNPDTVVPDGIGVTTSGKVVVAYRSGNPSTYKTAVLTYGGRGSNKSFAEMNAGNALTGYSLGRGAIAIGPYVVAPLKSVLIGSAATYVAGSSQATAVGAGASVGLDAIAIGYKAAAAQTRATVVGDQASATAIDTVVVGSLASATGANTVVVGKSAVGVATSVVVGYSASTTGGGTVAIGASAVSTNTNNVAIGSGAGVSNSGAIAIGQGSNSGGVDNIAIGRAANTTTWQRSVVIGAGLTSTASDQVLFGQKHIELTELSADPTASSSTAARFYVKDDATTGSALYVRTSVGTYKVQMA